MTILLYTGQWKDHRLSVTCHGYEMISMGPPSSGGTILIHLLNLLETYDLTASGFASTRTIALMTEAMKLAYADRAEFLGDVRFLSCPHREIDFKRICRTNEENSLIQMHRNQAALFRTAPFN